jgi:hypothetical protein
MISEVSPSMHVCSKLVEPFEESLILLDADDRGDFFTTFIDDELD